MQTKKLRNAKTVGQDRKEARLSTPEAVKPVAVAPVKKAKKKTAKK
jgi:hypothetical protein